MKIGIDLGGSHIAIGIVNNEGRIIEKFEKRITSVEKRNIKKSIEEYLFENIEYFLKNYNIEKIGIAIPGTISKGVIVKSVNLGIENYNIEEILKEKFKNIPIVIRNDAKCAALAESKYGALKEYNRCLFLTLGTGIGGAVLINKQLLNTGDLPGCEFGHMIIDKDGIPCNCGKNGCFERYSSMKALKNNLRKSLGLDEKTRGQELLDLIRKNGEQPEIKNIVEEFIDNLSTGISNLVNIFEPEAVGIGGSFVFFEDVLLEPLKQKLLSGKLLFNARDEINIYSAILENDAGIIGAVI